MRILLIFSVITITLCWARPQSSSTPNPLILKFDEYKFPNGTYRYNVETSDGFEKEELGEIRNPGTADESLAVAGRYSYVGDDGKTYSVIYRADENGFQPEGEHIAVPPPAEKKSPMFILVSTALVASLINGG